MAVVYPPVNATNLLINTSIEPKTVQLPAISTIGSGKVYVIKDTTGNAGTNNIYVSTTGVDAIDNRRTPYPRYALMSTNHETLVLVSDGISQWMVLSHYIQEAAPAPPPITWNPVTDGDGSVTNNGGGSFFVVGPNDGGGSGWAYIYAQFTTSGSFTYNFDWYTFDGINWDRPFEYVSSADPSNPANVDFNTQISFNNSETGSRTVSYGANQYVVLGVYSVDSVAGPGYCTFSSLPT